jgi:protein-disulfide isomerase
MAVAVVVVLVVVGVAVIGQGQSTNSFSDLRVSSKGPVPNAELNGQAWGPKDAPITVQEYIDYLCPACGQYAGSFEPQVIAAFAATGKVRYEIKHFPFKGEDSRAAAQGAYCAADQNRFWDFHSALFLNQPTTHSPTARFWSNERLVALAGRVGLDGGAFQQCLASDTYATQVRADLDRAASLAIQSTPTFVVNGHPYPGVQSVDDLRGIFAEVAPNVSFGQ